MRDETVTKIHSLGSRQKWINWVTAFGDKIDNLSDFNPKERHELLERVVEDIRVRTLGVRSHRLTIKFNLPYCNDSLSWIDSKDHSKGYKITGGTNLIQVPVTDAKKSTNNSFLRDRNML